MIINLVNTKRIKTHMFTTMWFIVCGPRSKRTREYMQSNMVSNERNETCLMSTLAPIVHTYTMSISPQSCTSVFRRVYREEWISICAGWQHDRINCEVTLPQWTELHRTLHNVHDTTAQIIPCRWHRTTNHITNIAHIVTNCTTNYIHHNLHIEC